MLSGAFVASRPQTVETAGALAVLWRDVRRGQVFPLNPLSAAIEDNRLSVTNAIGDAIAFSGGIHADGPITIRDRTRRRGAGRRHLERPVP